MDDQTFDPALVRRAAFDEAGRAFTEYLMGRELQRVECPEGELPEPLRRNLDPSPMVSRILELTEHLRQTPRGEQELWFLMGMLLAANGVSHPLVAGSSLLQSQTNYTLLGQIPRWLQEVELCRESNVVSAEEAASIRTDLLRPFVSWINQRAGARMPDVFSRRLAELVPILVGGAAQKRLMTGSINPNYGEALRCSLLLPFEERDRGMSWAYSRSEAIVEYFWPTIEGLAEALLTEPDIDGERATEVIEDGLAKQGFWKEDDKQEPAADAGR